MGPDLDLQLALRAADVADRITLSAFRRPSLQVEAKADQTPVSEADRGAEAAIRELLARERPADSVLGEETGSTGSGSRRWVIDPIDGTANFVRAIPVWATLIGLEVDGAVEVGVVSAPALGRRWWAERGEGAFAGVPGERGESIKVSRVARLAEAAISVGCVRDFPAPERYLELVAKVSRDRRLWGLLVPCARRRGCVRGGPGPGRVGVGCRRSPGHRGRSGRKVHRFFGTGPSRWRKRSFEQRPGP